MNSSHGFWENFTKVCIVYDYNMFLKRGPYVNYYSERLHIPSIFPDNLFLLSSFNLCLINKKNYVNSLGYTYIPHFKMLWIP